MDYGNRLSAELRTTSLCQNLMATNRCIPRSLVPKGKYSKFKSALKKCTSKPNMVLLLIGIIQRKKALKNIFHAKLSGCLKMNCFGSKNWLNGKKKLKTNLNGKKGGKWIFSLIVFLLLLLKEMFLICQLARLL